MQYYEPIVNKEIDNFVKTVTAASAMTTAFVKSPFNYNRYCSRAKEKYLNYLCTKPVNN